MALICKVLFLSISTFETPPLIVDGGALAGTGAKSYKLA